MNEHPRPSALDGETRRTATSADAPVVAVRDLTVRYGRNRVLDALGLEIAAGEVYALLGRNGAGKTSLLRCLLGQRKATAGGVALFGRDAWRHRAALLERVAVVPERPDVPAELPVRRAASFVAALRPAFDRGAFAERLERAGVEERQPFGTLSRGQQTLVGLALALSSRPELLVLDDPTLGLDAATRRAVLGEIVEALAAAQGALTVLLTSHDLRGVEQIATRVGFLTGGRIAVDLPLEELETRFRRVLVERGHAPAVRAEGVLRDRELAWARELVVRLEAGRDLAESAGMESVEMDLEEIFLAVCPPGDEGRARPESVEVAS